MPSIPKKVLNVVSIPWKICVAVLLISLLTAYFRVGQPGTKDTNDYTANPPWIIFRGKIFLVKVLQEMIDYFNPPAMQALELSYGLNRLVSTYSCIRAGWPEILAAGEKSGAELASHANMSVKMASRLLRACVALKLFREITQGDDISDERRRYVNKPLGDIMRGDHPSNKGMLKAFIGVQVEDFGLPFLRFYESLENDTIIPFAAAHKLTNTNNAIWDYYHQNQRQWEQFNRAMTSSDLFGTNAVVHDFPWAEKCSAIVDIGGGRGSFLAALLRNAPTTSGILFDQRSVIDQARLFWQEQYQDLLKRVTFREGDFTGEDTIPMSVSTEKGSCYVFKAVLHNWDDHHALMIIQNVAKAMLPGDRLLIVEPISDNRHPNTLHALLDIHMRVIGGQERSESQFSALLAKSGFKRPMLHETRSPTRVLEAVRKR